jgi:hypothetical protein
LRKKGVTLLVGIKGEKAEKKRLFLFNNQGKQQAIEADTFLLAAGETSGLEEWASLEKWDAGRVCWVGDVTGSRGILEAVAQGNFAGRSI